MANHETIVTGGGDGGAGLVIGIVLAVALVIGGIWMFNNGFFNGAPSGGSQVTIEAPTIEVPAPAAPAPTPAN
jgi:hypothetical protein